MTGNVIYGFNSNDRSAAPPVEPASIRFLAALHNRALSKRTCSRRGEILREAPRRAVDRDDDRDNKIYSGLISRRGTAFRDSRFLVSAIGCIFSRRGFNSLAHRDADRVLRERASSLSPFHNCCNVTSLRPQDFLLGVGSAPHTWPYACRNSARIPSECVASLVRVSATNRLLRRFDESSAQASAIIFVSALCSRSIFFTALVLRVFLRLIVSSLLF